MAASTSDLKPALVFVANEGTLMSTKIVSYVSTLSVALDEKHG